jgi:hypothetical protein
MATRINIIPLAQSDIGDVRFMEKFLTMAAMILASVDAIYYLQWLCDDSQGWLPLRRLRKIMQI